MSRLPVLKPRQAIAALEKAGFAVARIAGSHYQMFNEQSRRYVTVPHHSRDLPKGTLAAIMQQAGLSKDEFLKLI